MTATIRMAVKHLCKRCKRIIKPQFELCYWCLLAMKRAKGEI